MVLESYVLGTSGSLPLPRRGLSSVLLHREGKGFLFDCGEGLQVSMKHMHLRWKNLEVICITHSHADHVTGLPGILMLSAQVERDTPLTIICPEAVKNFITASRKELGMYLNYKIEYILLDGIERIEKVYECPDGEYDIFAFPGKHTRSVWGFSFVERPRHGKFFPEQATARGVPMGPLWAQLQKGVSVRLPNGDEVLPHEVLGESRQGRKISYVTDTRPTDEIARGMAGSDIVFCEGMFKHEHAAAAKEKYHMTGAEAAQLALRAGGIGMLGLLHFSPRYLTEDIAAIEQEAQAIFSGAFCCRDRMHIPVPYKEDGAEDGAKNGAEKYAAKNAAKNTDGGAKSMKTNIQEEGAKIDDTI